MELTTQKYSDYNKGLKKLKKSGNKIAIKKHLEFLKSIAAGIAPPIDHPLHGDKKGFFSVRLDQKQGLRLVYRTEYLNPEMGIVHLVCLGTHRECGT